MSAWFIGLLDQFQIASLTQQLGAKVMSIIVETKVFDARISSDLLPGCLGAVNRQWITLAPYPAQSSVAVDRDIGKNIIQDAAPVGEKRISRIVSVIGNTTRRPPLPSRTICLVPKFTSGHLSVTHSFCRNPRPERSQRTACNQVASPPSKLLRLQCPEVHGPFPLAP